MFGVLNFEQLCHANGIKPIIGCEIYMAAGSREAKEGTPEGSKYYHLILLAKNAEGHEQIRQLSTRAWMRSYVAGKMRRVPTYYQVLIDIIASNP